MQNPTLQDIADYCGLSKSTVAKVIGNPESIKVRPATASRVLTAARHLNYTTNYAAKMLRTQRSNTIGVLFPNVNSFYRELVTHLESQIARQGYFAFFSFWDPLDSSSYQASYQRMINHGVDGIITCDKNESIPDIHIPTVIFGNHLEKLDCVYPDKHDYAVRAISYLRQKGHRRIGFIGAVHDPRYQVICSELKKDGMDFHPEWLLGCSAFIRIGYEKMRELLSLKERPTAVIVHSDHLAFGAIHAAAEAGLSVPGDISILSYDNLPEAEFSNPPLTTFDQCFQYASEQLVNVLLKRIQNPSLPQQTVSYIMPLAERQSVKAINKESEHAQKKSR